jgi:hypothetical protein
MVAEMWPKVERLLTAALDKSSGERRPDDVRAELLDGGMQLWIITVGRRLAGAAVTTIMKFPAQTVCTTILLGGDAVALWSGALVDTLAAWARGLGCVELEAYGRLGWAREAKRWGFRRQYVVYRKSLA